jgi:hypothetical protein
MLVPDVYNSIYRKLEKMGVLQIKQYAVIRNDPYVPLCIDRLDEVTFALSQNPVVDGVIVADPDIEIKVDTSRKTAEPLTYQDPTTRKVVYAEPGRVNLATRNEITEFLDKWLTELINQGFKREI